MKSDRILKISVTRLKTAWQILEIALDYFEELKRTNPDIIDPVFDNVDNVGTIILETTDLLKSIS